MDKESGVQPYKISFYFFSKQGQLDEVSKIFADKFPDQKIIICEEISYNSKLSSENELKKYCLDIVPFTKGDAVNYLLKVTGINRGIVAGDSGNDVDMLLESKNLNGVLVGGYKKEAILSLKRVINDSSDSNWKNGKRSFQRVVNPDGIVKNIYIEPESEKRKASESIARAIEILERAERIFGKNKK